MRDLRLVIDPGHGGSRSRGTRVGDRDEADYVLAVARDLRAALVPWPVASWLAREDDVDVSFADRAKLAADVCADLALVLHVNAFGHDDPETGDFLADPKAHGMMAFVASGQISALDVAHTILRSAPAGLYQPKGRPWECTAADWTSRAYNCVREYGCPAVLVELGFRTNPGDLKTLTSAACRPGILAALVAGISRAVEQANS